MAREVGLATDVLDESRIEELKMGALLAVAQGSAEAPRGIVVTYTPPQVRPGAPGIGLVGKGGTFDTGGIALQPGGGVGEKKDDIAGGGGKTGGGGARWR